MRGTPQTKADGLVYTPYTWTYNCAIDASDRRVGADGVERVWLEHFHVRATFTQPRSHCNNVTYWTQRTITVDRDGEAPCYQPEVLTFERCNGSLGVFRGGRSRMAVADAQAIEALAGTAEADAEVEETVETTELS